MNAQDKGGLIPLHNAASYGVSSFMLTLKISEISKVKISVAVQREFNLTFSFYRKVNMRAKEVK